MKIFQEGYFELIIDAIFGFSFSGDSIREPFKTIIDVIKEIQEMKNKGKRLGQVVSIDVPSGWDVDQGNIFDRFYPDMLVSLTALKPCARYHLGPHYLGGRFIP